MPYGMHNHDKGRIYEEMAVKYLVLQGFRILERNYRCGHEEIDIIALDGDCIVFVEVKYRKDETFQHPLEAVNKAKQRAIQKVARYYLYRHHYPEDTPCRFDVFGFLDEEPILIKNAF